MQAFTLSSRLLTVSMTSCFMSLSWIPGSDGLGLLNLPNSETLPQTVPHVMVTRSHTIILLPLHNFNFAIVMNDDANACYAGYLICVLQRGRDPQVDNNWTITWNCKQNKLFSLEVASQLLSQQQKWNRTSLSRNYSYHYLLPICCFQQVIMQTQVLHDCKSEPRVSYTTPPICIHMDTHGHIPLVKYNP